MPFTEGQAELITSWRQIVLASAGLRQRLAEQLGIGVTEVIAISYLYHDGPLIPRDLGTNMGLSSGAMTALVDRLEESGIARRAPNPDDRRSQIISITPEGAQHMDSIYECYLAAAGPFIAGLSEDSRQRLVHGFTAVAAEFDKYAISEPDSDAPADPEAR